VLASRSNVASEEIFVLQIQRRGEPRPDDAAAMLLHCHEKIRTFAKLAIDAASAVNAPASERADAAAKVHRYFTVALPLHVADEERSIRPRLLAAAPTPAIVEALATMAKEHSQHEDLILELVPLWQASAADLARTISAAQRLEELLRAHLEMEEATILPALRSLPAEATRAIQDEMRARRQT
jgi:hemerythrin-like domain-containing protein